MAEVLPEFEQWMRGVGIELSPAIRLVAAAAGCSGLALGVQVRTCCCIACLTCCSLKVLLGLASRLDGLPHNQMRCGRPLRTDSPDAPPSTHPAQAARDVAEGERMATIPKAACLSIRTTELADVIEAEELGGGLGLVLAVMHERSLGAASKW